MDCVPAGPGQYESIIKSGAEYHGLTLERQHHQLQNAALWASLTVILGLSEASA